MNYTVRKAAPDDFPFISALFSEMLNAIHGTDKARGYMPGALDPFFTGSGSHILVAEVDKKIIAFLSIEEHREGDVDFIYLDDFSVTGQYRGRGVGTHLLKLSEAHARAQGFPYIVLHAELTNTRAIHLYERHGFRRDEVSGSRVRMIKPLNSV